MLKRLVLAAALLGGISSTGCRKSSQSPESTVRPQQDSSAARGKRRSGVPVVRTREVAQGDVRAALIHLQRVHFAYDSATLLPTSRDALTRAAAGLAAHPDVEIYVDGHTDDRGTDEYNLALGERRAQVVVAYLVRLGIDAARLHTVTFGEERPLVDADSDPARAQNRRAEFRLLRGHAELVLGDGTTYDDDGRPLAVVGRR